MRKFLQIKPGDEIRFIPGEAPPMLYEHHYVPGKNSVACKSRWEDCPICVVRAQHRGLVLHTILTCLRYRRSVHGEERAQLRTIVRLNVRQLREMGPGPVLMPERGILEPDITWWGPRP